MKFLHKHRLHPLTSTTSAIGIYYCNYSRLAKRRSQVVGFASGWAGTVEVNVKYVGAEDEPACIHVLPRLTFHANMLIIPSQSGECTLNKKEIAAAQPALCLHSPLRCTGTLFC